MNWVWFHKLASPPTAYAFARALRPWLFWPAALMMIWASYAGLFVVPPDYQQLDAFRIIFVHVPAASLSLLVYSRMHSVSSLYMCPQPRCHYLFTA